MTESAPQIRTYSIPEIREDLKGGLKLPEGATLKIAKPGSQNRMHVYGGADAEADFAALRNFMQEGYQLKISIGEHISPEDAGKARVFDGSESPDKPLPPATPIQDAFILFKKTALEQEENQPSTKESQNKPAIEIVSVLEENPDGRQTVRLKIDGVESPLDWKRKYDTKDIFFLDERSLKDAKGILEIPENTLFYILTYNGGFIRIRGGKEAKISLEELEKIYTTLGLAEVKLTGRDYERWEHESSLYPTELGKANFSNNSVGQMPRVFKENISVPEALELLKQSSLQKEKDSAEAAEVLREKKRFEETAKAREDFLASIKDPEKRQKMDEIFSKIVWDNDKLTPEDMDLWAKENGYMMWFIGGMDFDMCVGNNSRISVAEKALLSDKNLAEFKQILLEENIANNGRVRTALLVEFIHPPPEDKKDLRMLTDFAEIAKLWEKRIPKYVYYVGIRADLKRYADAGIDRDETKKLILANLEREIGNPANQ